MIVFWVLGGVVAVIAALMLLRFDLARMALRYLISSPRQTSMAVVGLMVAISTIVGAAVVTDSASNTLEERLDEKRGTTDVVLYPRWDFMGYSSIRNVFVVDGILGAADIEKRLLPVYAEGGLIDVDVPVYGIDKNYPTAVRWDAETGDVDEDLFMTRSMATRLDAQVGDNITVFFPDPELAQPPWDERFDKYQDLLVLDTLPDPFGFGPADDNPYLIAMPENAVRFDLNFTIIDDVGGDWVVRMQAPDGEIQEATTSGNRSFDAFSREFRNEPVIINWTKEDGFLPHGTYYIQFDGVSRNSAKAEARWSSVTIEGTPPWTWTPTTAVNLTMPLTAIVPDNANPSGTGEAVFIPKPVFYAATYNVESPSVVVARVVDGVDVPQLEADLRNAVHDPQAELVDLRTIPAAAAAELRREMTQMWIFMSGFTVMAAVVLLFVLVALLVDERRSTLATIRALGGTRSVLLRVQVFEVVGLSLMAGITGGLAGILVAQWLSRSTNDIWAVDRLVFTPLTIVQAAAVGMLLILVFASLASWRTTRLEVAPALRGLDAPARGSRLRDVLVASLIGLVGAFAALTSGPDDAVGLTVGVPMAALGVGLLASRWIPKGIVFPLVGAVFIFWMIATHEVLRQVETVAESAMLPLRAVLFAVGGGLVIAYIAPIYRLISALFAWLPGGLPFEQAVAQWRRRPARAALTIVLLSTMLMSVLFLSTILAADDEGLSQSAGGFDVVAHSPQTISDPHRWMENHPSLVEIDPFEGLTDSLHVPWAVSLSGNQWNGTSLEIPHAYGVTERFADLQRYQTVAGMPVEEAFVKAMEDPKILIIDKDLLAVDSDESDAPGPSVGDRVVFFNRITGAETRMTITTITDGGRMGSAFVHPDILETIAFQTNEGPMVGTAIFGFVDEGVDPDRVAARFESRFLEVGMEAQSIGKHETDAESVHAVLAVFVVLALAVGAVALGLVAARNVVQRRREIGMMRAIGATRQRMVATFALETILLVVMAVALGWIGARLLLRGLDPDLEYSMDAALAVYLSIYTLLLGAVSAIVPAIGAARLNPAVAVRNVE